VAVPVREAFQKKFEARHITSEVTTTSTTYVTIADSDVILDASWFEQNDRLYLRFVAHLKSDVSDASTFARLYRQHAGTVVEGTEVSVATTEYQIVDSGWIDMAGEAGLESYQVQMKTNASTGYCNSAITFLSSVPL